MNRTRHKYRKATLMSLVIETKQPICFQMLFKLGDLRKHIRNLQKQRLKSEILCF